MKINPIINPNVMRSYQATKSVSESKKAAGGRDEVTFSNEALSFSKALTDAREMLEVRTPAEQARLADLTDAVRQGTYKVDSEKVAEKILESVQGRR
ncbi:MAG: flagellar biosynthesis anti-sigma factor FlgM [Oscillospiraceae bacterium]|nr:flagellar biosynthesis anti-sigma factor FlgM [Oscillospiraceae bacterium]